MSTNLSSDSEVRRIAQDLSAKYGLDALSLAKIRADRALEIGDDLALAIWEQVLAAMNAMKPHQF